MVQYNILDRSMHQICALHSFDKLELDTEPFLIKHDQTLVNLLY